MSTPESSPVARVRRLAEALVAGCPPDPDDAVPVGMALLGLLEGDDLERRLGLVDGRPGPSWRRRGRWAERDKLIRELAALYQGEPTPRAREMSRDLRHYGSTAWLRDKFRGVPWSYTAKSALMFAIHSADPDKPPPTSPAALFNIIRAG